MSLSSLNIEELDQVRKQKLHKMLQYLVSVNALGFGWFLVTQKLSFAPKLFSAEGLGVHRLRTLLSLLALLCRCLEKTFHHLAARLFHPALLKSHHRGRWSASVLIVNLYENLKSRI